MTSEVEQRISQESTRHTLPMTDEFLGTREPSEVSVCFYFLPCVQNYEIQREHPVNRKNLKSQQRMKSFVFRNNKGVYEDPADSMDVQLLIF